MPCGAASRATVSFPSTVLESPTFPSIVVTFPPAIRLKTFPPRSAMITLPKESKARPPRFLNLAWCAGPSTTDAQDPGDPAYVRMKLFSTSKWRMEHPEYSAMSTFPSGRQRSSYGQLNLAWLAGRFDITPGDPPLPATVETLPVIGSIRRIVWLY